jgi:hypothetical protein
LLNSSSKIYGCGRLVTDLVVRARRRAIEREMRAKLKAEVGADCIPSASRVFLHLDFCMLTTRTIENEYRRNPFDVWDGEDSQT